jgi:hypothetical protein
MSYIGNHNIINKKKSKMTKDIYYSKDFWKKDFYLEYGWASCFECDVVFYDLEEHQEIHLKEESDAKR